MTSDPGVRYRRLCAPAPRRNRAESPISSAARRTASWMRAGHWA